MAARSIRIYRLSWPLLLALASTTLSAYAQTGVLNLGNPIAAGDTIRVPVELGGDVGNGVSAMDFRLTYDPAVFEPVAAAAGPALQSAGKLVEANVSRPGEYAVLIFGMNQSGVSGGEVASIELRVLDEPAAGATELAISNTTLSLANAQRLPSRGSSRTVRFDGQAPAEPAEPDPGPQQPPLSGGGGDSPDSEEEAGRGLVLGDSAVPAGASDRPGQPLEVVAKLVDQLRKAEALRSGLPPGGRGAVRAGDESTEAVEPHEGKGLEVADMAADSETLPTKAGAILMDESPDEATIAPVAANETPPTPAVAAEGRQTKKVAVGLAVMVVALLGALWGVRTIFVRQ